MTSNVSNFVYSTLFFGVGRDIVLGNVVVEDWEIEQNFLLLENFGVTTVDLDE